MIRRLHLVALALLVLAAPAHAAPVSGARYVARAQGLAVGLTPTADRRSFEPPGARDWQGSYVIARRSLPCVGGFQWRLDGTRGVEVVGSRFSIRRSARHGKATLKLTGHFGSRTTMRLVLRRGHCAFRRSLVARITHRLTGSCRPAHTKTLAASSEGRVYRENDVDDLGARQRNVYGCVFAVRSRFFLNEDEPPDEYVPAAATAGSLAAIASYNCPVDCGGAVVTVDLAAGTQRALGYVNPFCNQPETEPPEISSLVLAPSGSYAYIARGFAESGPHVNDVVKNVAGANTLLDCGTGIAAHSLTLSGSTLGWTNGGQPRSAPLE